jgi:hypothetical protein
MSDDLRKALEDIASGEAFRQQRFAEDDAEDYYLGVQRAVQTRARQALASALASSPPKVKGHPSGFGHGRRQ